MIFHKVVKNEPTLIKLFGLVTTKLGSFLFPSVQEEYDVNETMCFRADPSGGFKGSEDLEPSTLQHAITRFTNKWRLMPLMN